VNTFHYRRGGDCTYTFDLADLLRSKGDEVIHFAMKHPQNVESEFENKFVDHIDFGDSFRAGGLMSRLRAFRRSLYSDEARAKFASLLEATHPDIVHLQNFRRHLTFSIVEEARSRNIPVVFTAHDYDPICPNSLLLAHGKVCTACGGRNFHKAAFIRCKENSVMGSLAIALEGTYTRLKGFYDLIEIIITPSRFAADQLINGGFDPARVEVINNFVNVAGYQPCYGGRDFFNFGRLVIEKGIDHLIEAAARFKTARVLIAGDGPRRTVLESLAGALGAQNVEFLGYVDRDRLHERVAQAQALVMPSIWYENFPYSILEAFALGKPVIASDIGGIPETVVDGETGLLFEPGNARELAEKMKYLVANPEKAATMGRNARRRVENEFDSETHYRKLMAVYKSLM
jgi:glycosyltransferase involved in cell wall biosynthesis